VRLAIIRLFPDIACALEGMAACGIARMTRTLRPGPHIAVAHIVAKGRRELVLPSGAKAAPLPRVRAAHARWQPRGYGRQEGPPDGKRHLSDDQRPRQRDRASRSSPHQLRHTLSHYWLANGGANAAAGSSRRKVGAKGVTACLIISGPRRTWLSAHESLTLRDGHR
jgi:hypothetical protein